MNDRSILLGIVITVLVIITWKIFYSDRIEKIQSKQFNQILEKWRTSGINRSLEKIQAAFKPSGTTRSNKTSRLQNTSINNTSSENDDKEVIKYMERRLKDIQNQADMAEGFMQALDNVSHLAAVDDKIKQQDETYAKLKNEEYNVKKLINRIKNDEQK